MSEVLKNWTTAELVETRKTRKEQMEKLQENGWWVVASNYHETYIAPINQELTRRKVW